MLSCGGNSAKNSENATENVFPYVEVPSFITNEEEAALYIVRNFWSRYFKEAQKDTLLYSSEYKPFEEAYVNYIALLNVIEQARYAGPSGSTADGSIYNHQANDRAYNIACTSHKKLFAKADSLYSVGHKAPLMQLIGLGENYLYNPNSPYLNEENYIPMLEALLELKSLDSLQKLPYEYQLNMARLNRTGTKSNDFEYTYIVDSNLKNISHCSSALSFNTKKGTLHKLEADYLLIYFNNPDCGSCKEQQSALMSDPRIMQMCADGTIVVLAMYIDEQTDLWEENYKNTPKSWIYARDSKLILRDNEIYGIRAIPSMYLLDKKKNVLLKDASAAQVIRFFGMM